MPEVYTLNVLIGVLFFLSFRNISTKLIQDIKIGFIQFDEIFIQQESMGIEHGYAEVLPTGNKFKRPSKSQ